MPRAPMGRQAGPKSARPGGGIIPRFYRPRQTGSAGQHPERIIRSLAGIHIPHNALHRILKGADFADTQPKKSRRRKRIRYERERPNSMRHTDYKQLDDGRRFLCYEDDASRFVTGLGVFQRLDP